jgi:monoamine oxidase
MSDATSDRLTRRHFINLVGGAGGFAAAYSTMAAMGLLTVPAAYAGPPELPIGSGHNVSVVIIGAGIAGMCAAYRLSKAGYSCTILEARSRAGGRSWTLRGGDKVEEINSMQRVRWNRAEHLYFNAGPARLAHHHRAVLEYCREFAVPLEIMANDNPNAWLQDSATFDGKPVRMRTVRNDLNGHVAELLAKAVNQGTLDDSLDANDKEKLIAFVRDFGMLQRDLVYRRAGRTGYAAPPAAGQEIGELNEPIALRSLIDNSFWEHTASFRDLNQQSATMLQPVGGMDRIAAAFEHRVKPLIRFNSVVTSIRRVGERQSRVTYRNRVTDVIRVIDADFVLVTVPLPVLATIPSDFSARHKRAISSADYVPAGKVAFYAKRRFWEEDDQIYGGISWTTQEITQMWYPSYGIHARDGVIVGAYIWSDGPGNKFSKNSPAERIRQAMDQGARLHRDYSSEVSKGVAVSWINVPFSMGGWCNWSDSVKRESFPVLLEPDGPLLLAGDHVSDLPGWQEGAIRSAHKAIETIAHIRRG